MADEENFSVYTEEPLELGEATPTADEPTEEAEAQKESDATATSDEAKTEPSDEDHKEGHTRFQKRIDKLVRQREDAERRAEELERELQSIKTLPKKQAKLDPLDFDSYEDYVEAVNAQTNEAKEVKPEPKRQEPTADTALYRKLDDVFDEAREAHEDFDEVTRDPSIPFTVPLLQVLAEVDNAGEVAYFLAKNKEEVKRISELSTYRQAIELGKLSDKLTNPPKAEKKTTKAPDPIDPVSPKGDVSSKDPSKMSFKEYEAYQNSQTSNKKGFW